MTNYSTTLTGYPLTFAEELQPLPEDLGTVGIAAREDVESRGFMVAAGLTLALRGQLADIAREDDIVDYCPKEPTEKRFGDLESTTKWLAKGDTELDRYGRGMFLLLKKVGGGAVDLAGYGWTGPELSPKIQEDQPERIVPGGETTFAIRISKKYTGQGLALPLTQLIVAGSNVMYGAHDIWLETWASNHAGNVYRKAGFDKVDYEKEDTRPTNKPDGTVIGGHVAKGGKVKDTRLWMTYPEDLLPQAA